MTDQQPTFETTAIGMALNVAWAAANGQVHPEKNAGWMAVVEQADRELRSIRNALRMADDD